MATPKPPSDRLDISGRERRSAGELVLPRREERLGRAMGLSTAGHVALVLALAFLASTTPRFVDILPPERLPIEIVWLDQPGDAGGGGGGGADTLEPPAPLEAPGEEPVTLPVEAAPEPVPETPPEPEVEPEPPRLRVDVPAQRMAAGLMTVPGALASGDVSGSVGPGRGLGAGNGDGDGIGDGDGDGVGEGSGGNTGGGPPGPGSGVTSPVALREVKPAYTAEALRAKIQGSVWVQCVVRPDGACSDFQVIRSLDSRFGLDDEAVKAARQWRFMPATRGGEPVSVPVVIQLDFALR